MRYRYLLFYFLLLVNSSIHAKQRHIALVITSGWTGEVALAFRAQKACQNLHWKADIIDVHNSKNLKKNQYDFAIHFTPRKYKQPKCQNYLTIFDPIHHYFKDDGFLKKEYRSYDGYLLTYTPHIAGKEKKDFVDQRKFPYMQWYPTVHKREFKRVNPSQLFYFLCLWGDRFFNTKFQECIRLLDKEPYTRFYGLPLFNDLSFRPERYLGQILFDSDSVCNAIADAGVALVIHSSDHNAFGIPSGRIFEATAASAVIICDENLFVRTHFKDSVLYIDTSKDGLSIFEQIQKHMRWICANKVAALKLAKKAHNIYKRHFLLEDQLLKLERFHERLVRKKREGQNKK